MNSNKIVDLEYHPHSEEPEIPEDDEMGIAAGVDVNIPILFVKLVLIMGFIALVVAILQPHLR